MSISTEDLWDEFLLCKNGVQTKTDQSACNQVTYSICKSCEGTNLKYTPDEVICGECGYILSQFLCDNYNYSPAVETSHVKKSCKVNKLQNWYMFTNEEKNNYKLVTYTKDLCTKLEINESIIPAICETVVMVLNSIKKYDGTKRARVKDGIILSCIQYVYKTSSLSNHMSSIELAKKIELDIKYITKAEKLILEMINNGCLNLDRDTILDIKTPYHYVQEVIYKHNLKIHSVILDQIKLLISVCENKDLLLDHTPLSIGVCCFYYILKLSQIEIDIKLFSDLYELSVVTVLKTFNKLKQQSHILKEYNLNF